MDLSAIATEIEKNFIAGLKGLVPTPDQAALISRVTQRLATASVYVVGSAQQQAAVKQALDLDLATLGNIGSDIGINAELLARQTAAKVINDAITIGLKILIGAVAA